MTAVWSNHVAHAEGGERISHLEDVAIHVIREAWGQFERPALQLADNSASLALLHLAEKAFWPARVPFEILPVTQDSARHDAVVAAPRGEWDHRVTTGVFAVGGSASAGFGTADQRRDLWDLFNGRRRAGEQVRILPLSTWTAQDVAAYLQREGMNPIEDAVVATSAAVAR